MKKLTAHMMIVCSSVLIVASATGQTPSSVATDNARSNKTDASNATATADAQTNKSADIELTKRIRQSLMSDGKLSTYARNIKIVTINGRVTLNGVVRSEDESSAIQSRAADIAGASSVTSLLKVAPKSQ
jgi:hyperosmotically inducible protein